MTIHDQITWILIQNSKYGQIPRRAVVWFHPRGLQTLSLHCFGRGGFFPEWNCSESREYSIRPDASLQTRHGGIGWFRYLPCSAATIRRCPWQMITRAIEPVPPGRKSGPAVWPCGASGIQEKEQCHRRRSGRAEPKNTKPK